MTERPIKLYPHEVRGIIAGPQTQLRRVVRPQPELRSVAGVALMWCFRKRRSDRYWLLPNSAQDVLAECPHGGPGDRLWARETFCDDWKDTNGVQYKADGGIDADMYDAGCRWRPSIHMPRWASRILLEITDVRVERVQAISEEDAIAEGVERTVTRDGWRRYASQCDELAGLYPCEGPRESFRSIWALLYGPDSWRANPWVWAITFRRLKP